MYSRTNPFKAEVLENLNLNGRGSNKETRHIELSLEGSGLTFEPGDIVGIYPTNDPELVDVILQETKWNPEESVTINKQGDVLPLKEALSSHFEITALTKSLLKQAAQLSANEALQELVAAGNEEKVKAYMAGRDLLDLIRDFGPWTVSAQEFISILRKLPARLYSIASSFAANPDEVHLTIGAVRYEAHGRERKGVCSTLMCRTLTARGHIANLYSTITNILSFQRTQKHRSSWLVREQGLHHSAPLCRSVKKSEHKENHGCSLVISIS